MKTGKQLRDIALNSDPGIDKELKLISDCCLNAAENGNIGIVYRVTLKSQIDRIKGRLPEDLNFQILESDLIKISW